MFVFMFVFVLISLLVLLGFDIIFIYKMCLKRLTTIKKSNQVI